MIGVELKASWGSMSVMGCYANHRNFVRSLNFVNLQRQFCIRLALT